MHVEILPSQFLEFEYSPDQISTSILKLKNIFNAPVCFKVKTTAPKCYVVKPCIGHLDVAESKELIITIQPGIDTRSELNHKFSIQTAPVSVVGEGPDWVSRFWSVTPAGVQDVRLAVKIVDLNTYKTSHSFNSVVSELKVDRSENNKHDIRDLKEFQEKQEGIKRKLEEEYKKMVDMMKTREQEINKCQEEGLKGFGTVHMMLACFLGIIIGYFYAIITT